MKPVNFDQELKELAGETIGLIRLKDCLYLHRCCSWCDGAWQLKAKLNGQQAII
jgi:hypothetical protein